MQAEINEIENIKQPRKTHIGSFKRSKKHTFRQADQKNRGEEEEKKKKKEKRKQTPMNTSGTKRETLLPTLRK